MWYNSCKNKILIPGIQIIVWDQKLPKKFYLPPSMSIQSDLTFETWSKRDKHGWILGLIPLAEWLLLNEFWKVLGIYTWLGLLIAEFFEWSSWDLGRSLLSFLNDHLGAWAAHCRAFLNLNGPDILNLYQFEFWKHLNEIWKIKISQQPSVVEQNGRNF